MTFTQAENNWLIKVTGVSGPRDELKKRYFRSQGAVGYSLGELETNWLKVKIQSLGGNPDSSNFDSDLWKQLVALSGFRVSKSTSENQLTYYLNS